MTTALQEDLLTDVEVADKLRISIQTLRLHLHNGPPKGGGDVRKIRHFMVGGSRRWVRGSVEKFING
jgi:hypothetical protein